MANDIIARIYRETVASYGREGVDRSVAIQAATERVLVEIREGRYRVDELAAIRSELVTVDEREGRTADQILRRAAGTDAMPLEAADLDIIVTLGGGRRKPWAEVTHSDLRSMNEIRFQNYRRAKAAYDDFSEAYSLLREPLFMHGTVGAAFAAQGLPEPKLAAAS